MDLTCGCGFCSECENREWSLDAQWKNSLSDEEFIFHFGKKEWFRRYADKKPKPIKTPEEEIEWSKFWNETLWKVSQLRKEYERHWNELKRKEA